jgi:hypothetical protein
MLEETVKPSRHNRRRKVAKYNRKVKTFHRKLGGQGNKNVGFEAVALVLLFTCARHVAKWSVLSSVKHGCLCHELSIKLTHVSSKQKGPRNFSAAMCLSHTDKMVFKEAFIFHSKKLTTCCRKQTKRLLVI